MRSGEKADTRPPTDRSETVRSGPTVGFAVELRGVTYRVDGGRELISNLTLAVERGETLILLGRSGSGKTTALKLINRLLEPTLGEILIDGRSQSGWDPVRLRRGIGYVMQEAGLFPHWTVERNVALVPRLEGWPEERVRERTRQMLTLVGLDPAEFAARHPRELSGGQRQRVGVARALAADPPVLLMDEPFGALDPVTRAELQREFGSLAKDLGKSILFVTHDLHEAMLLGTRIALLAAGRLVGLYRPEEFLAASEPEARAFVASMGDNVKSKSPG